jgi:hypothetical protein
MNVSVKFSSNEAQTIMSNYTTFNSSAQILAWLISLCKPMITDDGSALPGTGIASVTVSESLVKKLLFGGAQERVAGKQTVYNFIRDGKAYTLKVNFGHSNMKRITFTYDHRTEELETVAVTAEGETELFKFFYRDLSDRMTMAIQPWEAINNYRMMDGKWQVQKQIGDCWVIIAESKNWHFESVSEKMRKQQKPQTKSSVVNGLLVEHDADGERIRIYFSDSKDPVFSSHIKIYKNKYISVEGNVTTENFVGFTQASGMARHYLWT